MTKMVPARKAAMRDHLRQVRARRMDCTVSRRVFTLTVGGASPSSLVGAVFAFSIRRFHGSSESFIFGDLRVRAF